MDVSRNGECPGLAALMQPLFCKLCETRLNSPFQASAHYAGKNHLKKVKIFLQKAKSELTSPIAGDNKEEICVSSEVSPPVKVKTSNVPPDNVFDAKLLGLYCKLCDISFNSEMQAQQHYNGRNHQRRIQGEPALPKGFYNATTNKWTRTPSEIDPKTELESAISCEQSQGIKCTTCNCSVTSQLQLEMHLAGAKHRAKAAMLEKHNMIVSSAVPDQLLTALPGCRTSNPLRSEDCDGKGHYCKAPHSAVVKRESGFICNRLQGVISL